MKVVGINTRNSWLLINKRPVRPKNFGSFLSVTLWIRANSSTTQAPALWRVFAYSGPGLASPTRSLIG
ncbi:Uncharacterised protein [Vibrio cholerae]|nr:Uncharacterised protein [Vibrio cholerae]